MCNAGGTDVCCQPQGPRSAGIPRRHMLIALQTGLIVAILAMVGIGVHRAATLSRVVWFVSGGLGIVTIAFLSWGMHFGWLSAPMVYGAVFWIFHFGLVFPAAIAPTVLDQFASWQRDWLDTPETTYAVLISSLFLACFALGVFLVRGRVDKQEAVVPDVTVVPGLVRGGWVCIVLGLVLVVLALRRFGIAVFLQPYEVYYSIHNSFSWPIAIIAFGLTLQAAGGRSVRSVLITAGLCYLPIATASALAGARTIPFFSAAVLGVVLAKRGMRVPRLATLIGAICALALISAVRVARQSGWLEVVRSGIASEALEPIRGLLELGGSLKPVYAVVDSIKGRGEDYFYGETYVYPFYRQVQRLTGTRRGTAYTDRRFVAVYISLRYGAIGFSTVAEAFFNGGILGVIVFSIVWGLVLGVLDRRASYSAYGLAVLSAVMIPMMINIRNSFIFVPAWILLGLATIGMCRRFLLPRRCDLACRSQLVPGGE